MPDDRPNKKETTPARGGRRRGRIVFSLAAAMVFVGLVPLATVAWKLIDSNRYALTTSQQEYQMLLARSIGREVEIRLEAVQAQLIRVSQAVGAAFQRSGTMARGEVRRTLSDVLDDRVISLRFTDLHGKTLDIHESGTVPERLEPLFDAGLRQVAELLATAPGEAMGLRLSPPIMLDGHPSRAALVVSTPVVAAGGFRGVLSALVDLQSLWNAVASEHRTGHTLFAMDGSGLVFASSDPVHVPTGEPLGDSPIVRRFMSVDGLSTETMPFTYGSGREQERFLGSYTVTDNGWGIFVQARQDQIYHPVRAMMKSTMTWGLLAIGFALLTAVFFAGSLSRPINRLAAASRAFATGDFSARVDVRAGNEIGELAETFNLMATDIERYVQRLRAAAEENNELFLGTIRALAQAIDAKDPYTRGHSVRVNKYSVIIARYLGMPNAEIRDIHVSSLMHDVGKIGIDDAILRKPGMLTAEEFDVMKTHAALGANIMAPIKQMKRILPGLRYHHERWNGSGYPEGLAGEGIPLMARIIAVADSFDAMTTSRPYQEPMSFDNAHQRVNDLTGTAFDERIVTAFNRAYEAGEFRSEDPALRQASAAG